MIIRSIKHKGLRRLMETDDRSGLPAPAVGKIRAIPSFLQDMTTAAEHHDVPIWKAHQLAGDRQGCWALHVTKNWRVTVRIDPNAVEIVDLDYQDDH